jgi:acyl carrier protein
MSKETEAELSDIFEQLGLIEAGKGAEDVAFADLDADSLTLMDLCVTLEDRYGFIIEPSDVMQQETLLNLARFIEEKRRDEPRP